MDSQDKEYLEGFNLGWEIEKATNDNSLKKEDRELITSIQKNLSKASGNSERIEGFKAGVKQYQRSKEIEKAKEQNRKRDMDRER